LVHIHIIKQIASSIRKLSEDRFVLVSFAHCNSAYEKSFLPVFDNTIEMRNDVNDGRTLLIGIKGVNHAVKRRDLRLKEPTRLS
jgi:hypothetical protein